MPRWNGCVWLKSCWRVSSTNHIHFLLQIKSNRKKNKLYDYQMTWHRIERSWRKKSRSSIALISWLLEALFVVVVVFFFRFASLSVGKTWFLVYFLSCLLPKIFGISMHCHEMDLCWKSKRVVFLVHRHTYTYIRMTNHIFKLNGSTYELIWCVK